MASWVVMLYGRRVFRLKMGLGLRDPGSGERRYGRGRRGRFALQATLRCISQFQFPISKTLLVNLLYAYQFLFLGPNTMIGATRQTY